MRLHSFATTTPESAIIIIIIILMYIICIHIIINTQLMTRPGVNQSVYYGFRPDTILSDI